MVAESMAPYWRDSLLRQFGRLDRDIRVDVAIVGGGITGITAAYLLKMAGRTAALLERGRCAQIDTGHTTAHLTCVTDTPLSSLVNEYGADHARAVWDAGFAAMAQIDGHIRSERIACDFEWVPGYLHAPAADGTSGAADTLREEAELAYRLGFDARYRERVPYMDQPGIEYGGQARFHPRKYLAALLERLDGDGSYVFEQTAVDQVRDEPLAAVANGHTVTCEHIVLATHNPLVGKSGLASASLLQTKLSLYTSYAVGGRISPGGIPDALFWDTADPYRYLRLEPHEGFDYVIFGGEDHKTGQQDDTRLCFERLEAALSRVVPGVDVTHRWSGQVIETSDGLPFIGETAARQFIATGFAGNGMTFGTLGAMMACDAVLGRRNPWRELFDLRRPAIRAGLWDYLAENKDYPYYLIRDRFTGPDGRTLRALRRGEGKILELDGERVAAYRAVDGSVTLRSPICTHMSCVVHWNAAEKTWDCPCHGSRFSPDGRVISGPAERPLQEASRDPLP